MSDENTITGHVLLFWETGMEYVAWAFQDKTKPTYDGLNTVENGDTLILDASENDAPVSLTVAYDYARNKTDIAGRLPGRTEPLLVQTISGIVVHGVPNDIDPALWVDWFTRERRGTLIKAAKPD